MLEEKNVQELINYIEEGQKRINSAKKKLVESTNDFEIWLRYCEDKTHYKFIFGADTPLMKLLSEYCEWILSNRYSEIDIYWVVEILNSLLQEGFITEEEVTTMKIYLHKINFGSMKINW